MEYTKGLKTGKTFLACGCEIYEQRGKYFISYCPKHKAAPELYEALKDSTSILRLMLQLMMTPEGERATNSMIEQNVKALAKAEGGKRGD